MASPSVPIALTNRLPRRAAASQAVAASASAARTIAETAGLPRMTTSGRVNPDPGGRRPGGYPGTRLTYSPGAAPGRTNRGEMAAAVSPAGTRTRHSEVADPRGDRH